MVKIMVKKIIIKVIKVVQKRKISIRKKVVVVWVIRRGIIKAIINYWLYSLRQSTQIKSCIQSLLSLPSLNPDLSKNFPNPIQTQTLIPIPTPIMETTITKTLTLHLRDQNPQINNINKSNNSSSSSCIKSINFHK